MCEIKNPKTNKLEYFYTTNCQNGEIYEILKNQDVGEQVGYFKEGTAIFS